MVIECARKHCVEAHGAAGDELNKLTMSPVVGLDGRRRATLWRSVLSSFARLRPCDGDWGGDQS